MNGLAAVLAGVLALVWGIALAAFLQFTKLGQFIATKRTWISVVVGVSGALAISFLLVPWHYVLMMTAILGASALGIVARSLYNEAVELMELVD